MGEQKPVWLDFTSVTVLQKTLTYMQWPPYLDALCTEKKEKRRNRNRINNQPTTPCVLIDAMQCRRQRHDCLSIKLISFSEMRIARLHSSVHDNIISSLIVWRHFTLLVDFASSFKTPLSCPESGEFAICSIYRKKAENISRKRWQRP